MIHKRIGDILMTMRRYREAIESYHAVVLNQRDLGEKGTEIISLIEKSQSAQDPEALAKEIQNAIVSISAAKRATRQGQSLIIEDNLGESTHSPSRKGAWRLGRARRQDGGRRRM